MRGLPLWIILLVGALSALLIWLGWHDRQSVLDVRAFFELFRLTGDNRILHSGGDAF